MKKIYKKNLKPKSIYKKNLYKGKLVLKEDVLHSNCVKWFYLQYGDFRIDKDAPMLCHIANETPRSSNKIQMIAYANKMKKLGKIKGIPDFFLRRKDGLVLFIELKAEDSNIKDEQKYIFDYMNKDLEFCKICKTEEEFVNVVNHFLKTEIT